MRYSSYILIVILLLLEAAPAYADYTESADSTLKAMQDEMRRSMKILNLGNHKAPYFVSYQIKEVDEFTVTASLNAITEKTRTKTRYLIPDVRVGSYNLDNSNYGYPVVASHTLRVNVPIEDNYKALRRAIWRSTDAAYKAAIENLESKKAYIAENNILNLLPDMTKEEPISHLEPVTALSVNEESWTKQIRVLSQVFQQFPLVTKSKVRFVARRINRWFINSEGTVVRDTRAEYGITARASGQAEDGFHNTDYDVVVAPDETQLPDFSLLEKQMYALADRVSKECKAPIGEDYSGPVLFEGQAAAEFLLWVLADNLGRAREPINQADSDNSWRNPLKDAIGRRILPSFISVVDSPKAIKFNNVPLFGGYQFDDDGIPAQEVVLVKNGKLQTFCASRIPSKHISKSNGHSILGQGQTSLLFVNSTKSSTREEMRAKALELAKDQGLAYVLAIRRLYDSYELNEYPPPREPDKAVSFDNPCSSMRIPDPLEVRKIYVSDGHEEPVRSMEFGWMTLRVLKDIEAVGNDASPYFVQSQGRKPCHLVTPSLLVKEVELHPEGPENDSCPILGAPLLEPQL